MLQDNETIACYRKGKLEITIELNGEVVIADKIGREIHLYDKEKYEMYYPIGILERMSEDSISKIKEITYVIALIVKNGLEHLTYKINRDELIEIYGECKARQKEYSGTDKEIENFIIYFYKSVKNHLVKKDNSSSFFKAKNEIETEEDEIILCKNPEGNTFNKIYENMGKKMEVLNGYNNYVHNSSIREGEILQIPNIKLKEKKEFKEI